MKFVLIFFFVLNILNAQVLERKLNCISHCKAAGDEMANTKKLYMSRESNRETLALTRSAKMNFPIRFLFVEKNLKSQSQYRKLADEALANLNKGFINSDIVFSLHKVDMLSSSLMIEDLDANNYSKYLEFSRSNDLQNIISVFVFDYDKTLCDVTPSSISCGRTSGFSFILSKLTNNIVLSMFDINDYKVIVHEMGHFFGLYHTFEEEQFGKDDFVGDCNVLGDCLCDTPPDPGTAYEVYVNYSKCMMQDLYHDNGHPYKPLIDNYMSYYKPCYMREFKFTNNQIEILSLSAKSEFRSMFSK